MGEREVVRAALTEVVKGVPQTADQGPAFLVEVRAVAIVAPQLDPSIASYQPYRPPELFLMETELVAKYKARLEALQATTKLKAEMNSATSESIRHSKKMELDVVRNEEKGLLEAHKLVTQRSFDRHSEEDQKIRTLMAQAQLSSEKDARFYLECQNWDLQAAVNFVKQTVAKPNSEFVLVNFRLPDGVSFSDRFEKTDMMWGMLTVVYRYLQRRKTIRSFQLRYQGRVLAEERLSSTTFEAMGISAVCDMEVVWS